MRWGRFRWWLRVTLGVISAFVVLATIAVVVRVRDQSPDRSAAVRDELRVLGDDLAAGAGERMQELFPEGYLFAHALHGLAWTDLATAGDADVDEARAAADRAVTALGSAAGTAPFSAELDPPFGVFHAAWSLLVRAQLARLEPAGTDPRLGADAERLATAFASALDAGRSPFLAAYPGQSWPVDSVVAMAALRAADAVTGADHEALIARWRDRAAELVDPTTGLLPHRTEPGTGRLLQGTRATSQSLIQRFWPVVDPTGAPAAYTRFRERFVTSVLGFVAVRDYPPGVEGGGDVDSGPLVLGVSASATAVTIGAARANGDLGLAAALTQEAEVFGLRVGHRYLLGQLPVADAFLAWSRSAPVAPGETQPGPVVWWPLHLVPVWLAVAAAWVLSGRARGGRGRPSAHLPTGAGHPPGQDPSSCT